MKGSERYYRMMEKKGVPPLLGPEAWVVIICALFVAVAFFISRCAE